MVRAQQPRVYLPTTARASHYLLAEVIPTPDFYASFDSIEDCYQAFAKVLFSLCDEYSLHNAHLIANDKLPVVRFSEEAYQFETGKQMLFFYNPAYHEAHKVHRHNGVASKKIRLLFLATGNDLRANSASFHSRVLMVIKALQQGIMTGQPNFKLRDHQHLSYDLFAKQKGHKESYSYKLRSLFLRYQARDCLIPTHHAEMTYATFSLPVSREMRNKFAALLHQDNYGPFYEHIAREFQQACERTNLSISAMVANGASPIVRNSKIDKNDGNAELQKLSFDVTTNDPQFKCFYHASELEENLHFVIVAADKDRQASGYSKFMNQVEKALHHFCDGLPINKERQGLTVRFYQHISYAI